MTPKNENVDRQALEDAIGHIRKLVVDGVIHGHFKAYLYVDVGNRGTRYLTIEAGKCDRFPIPLVNPNGDPKP